LAREDELEKKQQQKRNRVSFRKHTEAARRKRANAKAKAARQKNNDSALDSTLRILGSEKTIQPMNISAIEKARKKNRTKAWRRDALRIHGRRRK
jgi:hypothetical protein